MAFGPKEPTVQRLLEGPSAYIACVCVCELMHTYSHTYIYMYICHMYMYMYTYVEKDRQVHLGLARDPKSVKVHTTWVHGP